MEKKYKALRFMGTLYKVLSFIVLALTILGVLGMDIALLAGGEMLSDMFEMDMGGWEAIFAVIFTIFGLIGGGLAFVSMYAVADVVDWLISVEESTRFTALQLRERTQ